MPYECVSPVFKLVDVTSIYNIPGKEYRSLTMLYKITLFIFNLPSDATFDVLQVLHCFCLTFSCHLRFPDF